mmetsp:Transcript_9204/g.12646  ORF Transcript_9204/g.12646 Transcript_9204/m.12646 type:complete len:636 (+) Transcript_9204:51-1958(+)
MAYSRISISGFLFLLLVCIYTVTIVAEPFQSSDVNLEDDEDSEPYVPPKQSVYESMYKKDQDHQKKSVYERLYKQPRPEAQPIPIPKESSGIDFFPRSTDHSSNDASIGPRRFSRYLPVIFVSIIIVSLVLITILRKFPKLSWSNKAPSTNEIKPVVSPSPSPTRASEKKKRKTMLRRLQEIPKQQAQEIVQNDVEQLIRTDSANLKDSKEKLDSPEKKEPSTSPLNDNAHDSDAEMLDAKESSKSKYSTVATMDHKPKRKKIPLRFPEDKKSLETSPQKEPRPIEKPVEPQEEKSLALVPQPNSNPTSPVKGTPGVPGTEQPDSVEPEELKKDQTSLSPTKQQPLNNNNKGSYPENMPPPSPRNERDTLFLYNLISSIKTENLTEEQKIAFAGLLVQKYAMDYEVEKRQSKQQEFFIKEQNKQKRHEDEIQLKLAASDEIFQNNMFLLATIILLGTWFFCLTQRYHGLVALILDYWWDFGQYFIDSLGITVQNNTQHAHWNWVNPFTLFEDMVLRTVNMLFALVASIFLAILTLRSPRLGLCITAYVALHVCWESLLRVLIASTPLYLTIFLCCSMLTTMYPKISYSRNMYKGLITVSAAVASFWIGYQLVLCDPLNPEKSPGSILCAILDFVL